MRAESRYSASLAPRISIGERRSCLDAGATHVPCSAWTNQSAVQASRRSAEGTRRKRRRKVSGCRSSADGRDAFARAMAYVLQHGLHPQSALRVSAQIHGRWIENDRAIVKVRWQAASTAHDARRAHAAGSLLPVHAQALYLLIASRRFGTWQGRGGRVLTYTVRGLGLSTDVGGSAERALSTRSLRVQRVPIPSSSSSSYCTLVPPSALYNYHSGGVQPARVADNAIVGESESERAIGAHARTQARAPSRLAHAPRGVRLRRGSATARE